MAATEAESCPLKKADRRVSGPTERGAAVNSLESERRCRRRPPAIQFLIFSFFFTIEMLKSTIEMLKSTIEMLKSNIEMLKSA